jgi:hypothetical protein
MYDSVFHSAYSLETLPRDAKILLLKTAGVRRRCMMLSKSFHLLCTHADYAASTRALTVRARSFRRHDRVESLVQYVSKTSPHCTDLEFRDCHLSGMQSINDHSRPCLTFYVFLVQRRLLVRLSLQSHINYTNYRSTTASSHVRTSSPY